MATASEYIRQKVKAAREERGLSQEKLAELFGTTQSSISGIERGRVDVSSVDLWRLAQVLGKPISYFFPEDVSLLSAQEQELVHMLRRLPEDARQANIASVRAQFEMQRKAPGILALPEHERESAAIEAFAQYMLAQGVQIRINEQGFPVLDGGDVVAIMEALDEDDQRLLLDAVRRLQGGKRR